VYKPILVKSYEINGSTIKLLDDGIWSYVVSPATQFWSKYSDYDDAEEVWFDQIRVAEYSKLEASDD
jgi:hypothetical protein